jgi:hypothetical protein
MTDTLATKQDISELETRMQAGFAAAKRDVQELEIRLDARFADLERRMTLRLGTMLVAGIGAVSALVTIL